MTGRPSGPALPPGWYAWILCEACRDEAGIPSVFRPAELNSDGSCFLTRQCFIPSPGRMVLEEMSRGRASHASSPVRIFWEHIKWRSSLGIDEEITPREIAKTFKEDMQKTHEQKASGRKVRKTIWLFVFSDVLIFSINIIPRRKRGIIHKSSPQFCWCIWGERLRRLLNGQFKRGPMAHDQSSSWSEFNEFIEQKGLLSRKLYIYIIGTFIEDAFMWTDAKAWNFSQGDGPSLARGSARVRNPCMTTSQPFVTTNTQNDTRHVRQDALVDRYQMKV